MQAYACDMLQLGLLLQEFNDALREGDGQRIIRCWRYFLLLFKATNQTRGIYTCSLIWLSSFSKNGHATHVELYSQYSWLPG